MAINPAMMAAAAGNAPPTAGPPAGTAATPPAGIALPRPPQVDPVALLKRLVKGAGPKKKRGATRYGKHKGGRHVSRRRRSRK
jgi:hypothetical protein